MTKENTPLIETQRLILRKFTQEDLEDIFLLYSDEEVNKFLPWFPIKTLAEAQQYLHHKIFPCYQEETAYCYGIALKSDNRVIGYIHMHDIGVSNDLGYGLRKEFWHTGIITEACLAVVNQLREANFPFITATHDVNNPHSGEVMKKIGMVYRYSFEEQWQPKDILVTFRMYQLNFNDSPKPTYMGYWNNHSKLFIEDGI